MTQDRFTTEAPDERDKPVNLDTSVAHPARVYDYWLGGKDNYAVDRETAERVVAANPYVVAGVRQNRAFLGRAVRYLAGEAGIRQFLDIGTGLPTADNTHEVAQRIDRSCRIVYVDNDPVILSHARALLTSTPEGATAYVDADLRDVEMIVQEAAGTLDFAQPIAIMLLMILQYIPDSQDPWGIVARLLEAVPPGSYLSVSDTASDVHADVVAESARRYNERLGAVRQTRRSRAEFTRFFGGLELVEPGVVSLPAWRAINSTSRNIPAYAAVARKP